MLTQNLRLLLRAVAALCLLLVSGSAVAHAQKSTAQKPAPQTSAAAKWRDVSGMYTFLQEGEFVQLNVESVESVLVGERNTPSAPTPKRPVTGFVSRFGDLESDKGAFLDHFFTKGSLYDDQLTFTTKPVHGVWFDFKGKIERTAGKAPAEEGYYVITGTLKRLSIDVNKKTSSQSSQVVLKSFPDLDADDSQKPRGQ